MIWPWDCDLWPRKRDLVSLWRLRGTADLNQLSAIKLIVKVNSIRATNHSERDSSFENVKRCYSARQMKKYFKYEHLQLIDWRPPLRVKKVWKEYENSQIDIFSAGKVLKSSPISFSDLNEALQWSIAPGILLLDLRRKVFFSRKILNWLAFLKLPF